MGVPALELEHGIEAVLGQRLQLELFGREGLCNDALGPAMLANIGGGIEPAGELEVEIVEIAEAAAEEEVLADVAERPLDLLSFCPIRPAGAGLEAVVPGKRQQRPAIDDIAGIIVPGQRGLHAGAKNLDRCPG